MNRRCGGARGSLAVEVVLMVPAVMMLVAFVVLVGRVQGVSLMVTDVADVAARVGSRADPAVSLVRARSAAFAELDRQRQLCLDAAVSTRWVRTDTARSVLVTVKCRAPVAGLSLLGVPGPMIEATSSEVVDVHRGGS